jgi:hypothetical protein
VLISVLPASLPADSTGLIIVTLSGSEFLDRDTITVSVSYLSGAVVSPIAATYHPATATIRAAIPPRWPIDPGDAVIAVSLNEGANLTPQPVTLGFYTVSSISPSGGPFSGSTRVTVTGLGFASSLALKCRFASSDSTGTFLSTSQIVCLSPSTISPDAAFVDVTVDGSLYTSTATVSFTYHTATPSVSAITPAVGPSGSTGSVTLHGTNFPVLQPAPLARVRFGTVESVSSSVTPTTIVVPLTTGTGVTPVYLALNGIDFTGDQVGTFAFYTVFSTEPALGPTSGGTPVLVMGSGFDTGVSTWVCRFGTVSVAATALSFSQLQCTTPVRVGGGATVSVSVSGDNGASFSSSSVQFAYYDAPTVSSVSPSSGPAQGGTVVTLTGTGFVVQDGRTVLCRFGALDAVAATVLSPTSMLCTALPGASVVTVEVSLNGRDYSTSGVTFAYFAITRVEPSMAVVTGGTEVTVTGSGFTRTAMPTTFCHFGPDAGAFPATRYIDNVRFTCTVPKMAAPGTVIIEITTNGDGYASDPTATVKLFYVPSIVSAEPLSGPIHGGYTVTLTGTSLPANPISPLCKFGTAAVVAVVHSATSTVTCTAPPGSGSTSLWVSFNGAEGSADLFAAPEPHHYFSIRSVSPTRGPITGGTNATVSGEGFAAAASYECVVTVRVGTPATTVVPASFVSSQALLCTLPVVANASLTRSTQMMRPSHVRQSSAPNLSPIEVTIRTKGHTETVGLPQRFEQYQVPTVSAVSPSSVPASGGPVTVYGTGFLDSTACRFGADVMATRLTPDAANSTVTNATLDLITNTSTIPSSPNAIVCIAPINPKATNLRVYVTSNGQQYHVAAPEVTFNFTACDPGHFAALDTDPCTQCSVGTYTNKEAARECDACPSNSFTDALGSTRCLPCPDHTSVKSGLGDALSRCTCDKDFYHPDGATGEECLTCPTGADCAGGTAIARARTGFWSATDSPYRFVQCDTDAACPGGDAGTCAEGHTGRMCAECIAGYFKSGASLCTKCPNGAPTILVAFVIFCVLLTIVLIKSVGGSTKAYAGTIGIATKFFQVW